MLRCKCLFGLEPLHPDCDTFSRFRGNNKFGTKKSSLARASQLHAPRTPIIMQETSDQESEPVCDEPSLQQKVDNVDFFRNVWDVVECGIFILDVLDNGAEFRFIGFNPAFIRMSEVSTDWLLGKTIGEAFSREVAKPFRQKYSECVHLGETISFEEQFQYGGCETWWSVTVAPLRNETKQIYQLVVTAKDISEQQTVKTLKERSKAEEIQKIAQARLGYLISESPGIIYCCKASEKSRLTFISQNSPAVLGYKPEEFLENPRFWISKIHPEDLPAVLSTLNLLFERGQCTYEYRFLHNDGNYRWIHDRVKITQDEDGNPLEILGYSFDITQRKIAEADLEQSKEQLQQKAQHLEQALKELQRTQTQLIQSEKMSSLGQLVAGVAHEINNPVSFIYSNLEPAEQYIKDLFNLIHLYQQNYPQPAPEIKDEIKAIDLDFLMTDLPKLLSSMTTGANRIKEIVLSLRNFSRMDEAEYKKVNLHEGIDSTLVILEHRLKAQPNRSAISVIKEYGNLPIVECYAGQMNQVFMNILNNAIDALEEWNSKNPHITSEKSFHIRINTEVYGNVVIIRIADNGVGIPEHLQARLFDPFFTTKAVGKGTGMGLSISYQIITEKHGGTLECVSSPGEGTEFMITIPRKQN
jgi:PAS domain S-box-containing protein